MKYIKKYESEVSSGNASGKAGVTSLPFGKGFYQSGNTGEPGITFTPSSEPTFGSYKKMKHSKKNLLKKLKKQKMFRIKNFENWTTNVTDNYIVNYNDKTT